MRGKAQAKQEVAEASIQDKEVSETREAIVIVAKAIHAEFRRSAGASAPQWEGLPSVVKERFTREAVAALEALAIKGFEVRK